MSNSFDSRTTLNVAGKDYTIYQLSAIEKTFPQVAKLPFSLKILLENLLRTENGVSVRKQDIEALAKWNPTAEPDAEIGFTPARVLLQDFTGVPAVVDLAAMRDAMKRLGGDPTKINPLQPAELVIDHSVQVDDFGNPQAFFNNTKLEFERNQERYVFLRWGQNALRNFKVVPPETGIVHQVNIEYLARVVFVNDENVAYPDTLVGTDSHTTMVNGLGVLGWGVGGIEAEAAMLGQPVSMLIPQVVGFRMHGKLKEGVTATDLVLTVTQILRKRGVVGKFVEFFGEGLAELPLADRATIANMAPEYGATCGIFPVDEETLRYLRTTGRPESLVQLVEGYYKAQGLFHTKDTPVASYSDTLELDVSTVVPSLAGPSRPQDRVTLTDMKKVFAEALPNLLVGDKKKPLAVTQVSVAGEEGLPLTKPLEPPVGASIEDIGGPGHDEVTERTAKKLRHGSVVIAAITSCTNTSNPSVMIAAGLVAQKAVALGLTRKAHVKTSLAPGSKIVTDYLQSSGLLDPLEQLGFYVVGYGCTTCIAEGTPVSLANGTSVPIERMPSLGGSIILAPTSERELTVAVHAETWAKGEQECVALTLQDGRMLVCTPDHEILTADGRWVRADGLAPTDRVVVGLENPTDVPQADESRFMLTAGEFVLSMEDPSARSRTLAFARLLGHLLGDGSISTAGQGRMHVGQALDLEVVLNDIELLTGKRPVANEYDERKWTIVLPLRLTEAFVSLVGVRVGRRIDQPATLPEFLLDESCPVAVVREFLAGMFGADGTAPVLKRLGDREEDAILEQPAYSQAAKPEHVPQLKAVMAQVLRLLDRCGVDVEDARVHEFPVRYSASSYTPSRDEVQRTEVRLELPDGLSFIERVGFRYCIDKAMRSAAAAVYWRTIDRIHHQRLWMAERLEKLHAERPELSFPQAREVAAAELRSRETVVFPHYSLLEGLDRFTRLPKPDDRKFRPLHRESCGFPSPVEVLREIGVRDWFAPLQSRETADHAKRYCADRNALSVPSFSLRLIDRRDAGRRAVYDIAVNDRHAFIAGSVCVHNCIGNSGPLPEAVSKEIHDSSLVVAAVLSGNRNFEGRVHAEVRANYLASPPLVVAYAIAGRVDLDLTTDPVGYTPDNQPVYLKDIWPTQAEVSAIIEKSVTAESYKRIYNDVFTGDENWQALNVPTGELYSWDESSTYVKNPPYFDGMTMIPPEIEDITGARVLALLGKSITTDHISPAGSIKESSPAGRYLISQGVTKKDFNSYGARRGNHEVMMRGTFANPRLKNKLVPDTEGGETRYLVDGMPMSIYEASMKYQEAKIPLIIIAGTEYGSGSSRDWAAKGTKLLGVRAVIAESYERIHRSNLVGMGVLPLQFKAGETPTTIGLNGEEVFEIVGLVEGLYSGFAKGRDLVVKAKKADGKVIEFTAVARIDTPQEVLYYLHGGILPYVLRQLIAAK